MILDFTTVIIGRVAEISISTIFRLRWVARLLFTTHTSYTLEEFIFVGFERNKLRDREFVLISRVITLQRRSLGSVSKDEYLQLLCDRMHQLVDEKASRRSEFDAR